MMVKLPAKKVIPWMCGILLGCVLGGMVSPMVLYNKRPQSVANQLLYLAGLGGEKKYYSYSRNEKWDGVQSPTHPEWSVRRGFDVQLAAKGFDLPVNIAFVPQPSDEPDAPLYYVNELRGSIKCVTRNGSVVTYATGLLNFEPLARHGLSGLMVIPGSEDLLVAGVYEEESSGLLSNRILKLVSEPGGRTMREMNVLLDFGEFTGGDHQIQQLNQGPDGKLYVSVGDGVNSQLSLDLNKFGGKILRMNFDGSACIDNPFYDERAPQSPRSYVLAYGLRNVFDFDFDAVSQQLYAVDSGLAVDRLCRIVAGAGYGWNGMNARVRINALYTWGPHKSVSPDGNTYSRGSSPVGVSFLKGGTLGEGTVGNLYVGLFHGKSIEEFPVDPKTGLLIRAPERLIQYIGLEDDPYGSAVLGLAEGPDGLYFTDMVGAAWNPDQGWEEQSERTAQGAVWKVVRSEETLGLKLHSEAQLEKLTQIERGKIRFHRNCRQCHRLSSVGGYQGPDLTQAAKHLRGRLNSRDYTAKVNTILNSKKSFLIEQHERLEDVLKVAGMTRVKVWLQHHLEEPRFDNIYARMPSFKTFPQKDRDDIIAFLMTLE